MPSSDKASIQIGDEFWGNIDDETCNNTAGLDLTHAPEVVGDGTNGQVGPFEAALGTFYTGNVLPLVVGALHVAWFLLH